MSKEAIYHREWIFALAYVTIPPATVMSPTCHELAEPWAAPYTRMVRLSQPPSRYEWAVPWAVPCTRMVRLAQPPSRVMGGRAVY